MFNEKKLLSLDEAQQIAKMFLLAQHYESKLDFTDYQLIDKGTTRVYQLRGKITMRSRSPMSRFVIPKHANQHHFRIEIDAYHREIIDYEVT